MATVVPLSLNRRSTVTPIASTTQADFDKTAPYTPDRQLTEAADQTVILTLSIEGMGGINDYSVRIELPAFDDHLQRIADLVYQVHAAAFAVNWAPEPPPPPEKGS
jgi:hypothetical protein